MTARDLTNGDRHDGHAAVDMDRARCLWVLGQERDGRPQSAAELSAAHAFAAAHPDVARAAAEEAAASDALADLPTERASDDFTDRVLAARVTQRADGPQSIVHLGRRVAAAAAIVLGLLVAYDAGSPVDTLAGEQTERQRFETEVFRSGPYARPDLEAGLRRLMPGPYDGPPALRAAGEPPAGDGQAPGQDERTDPGGDDR